jgi:hypothetical protein
MQLLFVLPGAAAAGATLALSGAPNQDDTRARADKIGDGDLINVCFGPLCGLKADISRGPRR